MKWASGLYRWTVISIVGNKVWITTKEGGTGDCVIKLNMLERIDD